MMAILNVVLMKIILTPINRLFFQKNDKTDGNHVCIRYGD